MYLSDMNMAADSSLLMWLTFAVIIFAMVSYAWEKIQLETTSLIVLSLLLLIFQLAQMTGLQNEIATADLLAGFGNPALIAVLSLLVMGQGLFQSGAMEGITERFTSLATRRPKLSIVLLMLIAMIISAFLNNTPVVIMLIPILAGIVGQTAITPPRVMMSLSFICILGGMTTLIGSSTNLLVAGSIVQHGYEKIGFFDITLPGLFLAVIGSFYVLFIMPYFFRSARHSEASAVPEQSGKQYIIEFQLSARDSLVGATPVAGFFPTLTGITLRMIERQGKTLLPPFDKCTLEAGDTLVLAATRRQLTEALRTPEHPLVNFVQFSVAGSDEEAQPMLAEVVIAPGSRMQGRTIYQTGFHFETGCRVLGVQRRSRMVRQNLRDIRLTAGDVLLVLGSGEQIQTLRANRDVLLLEWSASKLPNFAYARRAWLIFCSVIILAALNILPIVTLVMAGAAIMILTGVLNIRQAARGVNVQIMLIIATALAMSTALERTGGADFLIYYFLSLFAQASPAIILSAFFLLCAAITNILSNNATAVLFAPLALVLADNLGVPPEPFIFAVIFAANCSFATPIAYQTNLLVMTPGNYHFRDFIRAGLPLILLIWLAYSFFAPYYFNLS